RGCGRVGVVEEAGGHHRPGRAVVGDGEGAALDLVGRQAPALGPAGEVHDLAGDGPQALGVGVPDHRHQQALVTQIHGDAEVDELVHDELAVAHGGVEVGEVGEGVDHGPADERQVGEGEAFGALPLALDG